MYSDLEKDVLEDVLAKLEEDCTWEDNSNDLAFSLWQAENIDGTSTYSTWDAQEWIKYHFSDLGEYVEEYNKDFDESPKNPFNNPESFMVQIQIYITSCLLSALWYDGIDKDDLIATIKDIVG